MTANAPLAMMLAGGTGGHVYPALAVALDLRERGFRLAWIGTRRGLEGRVVPESDINLYALPMRGLRGKGILQQLLAILLLGWSLLRSLWLMLRLRPALVVGMGGYASFPAACAAWITRRPLLLQEQNAVPGSANRALARFADEIATGFPGVLKEYATAHYLGNPVRRDLLSVARDHPWTPVSAAPLGALPLRVLVLGGSLGARPLNDAI
ncbi:MAG: glycosyltransferase, partial [Congregibacter sp.]|nr:glycosyltransferase [Congregibacter sp.]